MATLLLSLGLLAIGILLLLVKVLLKKNGKFSSQHVHDNPGLRKQGIHCVVDQDREENAKEHFEFSGNCSCCCPVIGIMQQISASGRG